MEIRITLAENGFVAMIGYGKQYIYPKQEQLIEAMPMLVKEAEETRKQMEMPMQVGVAQSTLK